MTIFLNLHRPVGEAEVWCYSPSPSSYVSFVDLQQWLTDRMGISALPGHRVKMFFHGIECTPHDEFYDGVTVDAMVYRTYWEATVLTYEDNSSAVWSGRFPSEQDAVQNLFVWLVKSGWLDIQKFLDQPEVLDNADDREIRRQLLEVLENQEHAEIENSDQLWEWCRVLGKDFPEKWMFNVQSRHKLMQ